ncbi:MAG: YjbQ family protein [archaeon]|nr:MAG: YjbQ family protein [archaeon]
METFTVKTSKREEVLDITSQVEKIVSKTKQGICLVYIPHATAALTINENYDQKVCDDLLDYLRKQIPKGKWKHDIHDGNGDSHIKAGIIGPSVTIPIEKGKLALGTYQGIMLCEFDGPRIRKIYVQIK